MTARGMPLVERVVARLAEAADTRTHGRYTWTVTRDTNDVSLSVEQAGRDRVVAYVSPADARHIVVRTANRSHRLGADDDLAPIVAELVLASATLTRLDLVPGTRFRVKHAVRELEEGTIVELVAIGEHKPSGRDLYQLRTGERVLEWCEDDPAIVALIDDIGAYLVFA